ncbi:MAG: glycine cleavage system protein GcvH [Deltaproteobacteria bacterium]|nr:glycine cleavage system protein GcvH [Deltaproteobacteria bacterium]
MSTFPDDLRYTNEHEWLKKEGDVVIIGITDHAQDALGDIVFLELPEAGTEISKGKHFGVVESVKAVSDLYAPVDGEVTEANESLVDAPEEINENAYGSWMLKVKPTSMSDVDALMSAADYQAFLASEEK